MDVSPKTLREVEFREKMRGYHPEDVDQFLEEVANGLEALQDRLRQAVDRAQRAEAAASDVGGGNDDTLRRTLVLAQRTADLAVQEARDQASRIVAGAEQQASAMLAEAEDRARRAHDDTLAESRTELARLEGVRQQAQSEIDMLRRWVDEHRGRFVSSMRESLAHLERTGVTSPPPTSRPLDIPGPRRTSVSGASVVPPSGLGPELTPSFGGPPPSVEVEAHPTGPATIAWPEPVKRPNGTEAGTAEARFAVARPAGPDPARVEGPRPEGPPAEGPRPQASRPDAPQAEGLPAEGSGPEGAGGAPEVIADLSAEEHRATGPNPQFTDEGPDDEALDNFFDEEHYAGDRRFGGRLRRRR